MSAVVQVSSINSVGVVPPTVQISRLWVQVGDYPGVENTTRYRVGGQWVPALAESVLVSGTWLLIT